MRRPRILPVLLVLLLSHAALFLLGRGGQDRGPEQDPEASMDQRPTKYGSRSRPDSDGEKVATRFTRLLHELEQAPLSRVAFLNARQELLCEWLGRDPRSAMDFIFSPTGGRYLRASLAEGVHKELHKVMSRQPREVWDWICERRYGSVTPEVHKIWLEVMEGDGQRELVLELLPGAPQFAMKDFTVYLCRRANAAELEKIRSFILSPQARDSDDYGRMVYEYGARLVKLSGGDPAKLLAAEEDPKLRTEIAEDWTIYGLDHLSTRDAVGGVAALPPDVRGAALEQLVDAERRGSGTGGVDLLVEIEAQQLLSGLSRRRFEQIAYTVGQDLSDASHLSTAEFLAQAARLQRPGLRHAVLRALAEEFDRTTEEVIEDLPGLPAGTDRDIFLQSLALELHSEDEAAERDALLSAIGDPALVEEVRKLHAELRDEEE